MFRIDTVIPYYRPTIQQSDSVLTMISQYLSAKAKAANAVADAELDSSSKNECVRANPPPRLPSLDADLILGSYVCPNLLVNSRPS